VGLVAVGLPVPVAGPRVLGTMWLILWEGCLSPKSSAHTSPDGRWIVPLDSCDPRWPTAIFFANSLPSNILCTDMLCGSQVHGTRISLCKLAMLVSYAEANSIAFSTPCFQQTIHPTSAACQIIMSHLSPICRIILTEVLLIAIIIVRPGSAWSLIQAIILGNFDSRHLEPFVADFLPARATFHRSRFSIIGHEEPQYYPCQ
jgi:hypothetical protein